jgi:uncharacterized protein (DUF2236 family)
LGVVDVADTARDQGFYGPDSVTWTLARERVLLLGGPRALLLQLAHPLVAAGVADHSTFASDPLRRLRRTLDATLAIAFGTRAGAETAAARINAVHAAVHGTLREDAGRYAAGTRYDATDPELLLWVHATLVDTTLTVYRRFVRELSDDEAARAYEESKTTARILGVPDEILPSDLTSFVSYFDEMIESDRIAVAPFQLALARDVLYPRLRFVPRAAHAPTASITAGLLPPKIRDAFGLTKRTLPLRLTTTAVRGLLPVLPRALREMPQARAADRRVR